MSDAPKKPEIIHRKKLFRGVMTADEVHREGMRERCTGCGGPAAIMIRVFAPFDEIEKRQGQGFLIHLARQNGGNVPLVDFKGSDGRPVKYVRVGLSYACDLCRVTAEREAAKGPSWCVVEIVRGPGPERQVVQVPS